MPNPPPLTLPPDVLAALVRRDVTVARVSAIYDVHTSSVYRAMKRAGVSLQPGAAHRDAAAARHADVLAYMAAENASARKTARHFGITVRTVRRIRARARAAAVEVSQ